MNNIRAVIIISAVIFFAGILILKLFDIQVIKNEELKYYAERQQTKIQKIKPERGLIYDRDNVLLVYNRNDVSFYVDLRMASGKDKEKIAQALSSALGKKKNEYLKIMNGSDRTICIEKKAPSEKAILLRNLKVNGFFSEEDPTRVYHYNSLAAHLLGYVGSDYSGVDGIAKSFNKQLQGNEGQRLIQQSAVGDIITVSDEETMPAVPGQNIYLTISKTYQTILEEELRKGLKDYGGSSAVGVIMQPNTGEILAFANENSFDPNLYFNFDNETRRNKVITDTYEPGSTFKAISLAVLLDQKVCKEEDLIFTENGKFKFNNVSITDNHKSGWLTVREVLEQSSNIGMAKLIQNIDDDLFYKYVRGFGFGNYSGIELPGEVRGTLKKPTEWSSVTKAFMSFGYGIAVTPIQMITAFSALINGGYLYAPIIVRKITSNDGINSEVKNPQLIRQVISEETSRRMREILHSVVENGTGKNAKVEGMAIGGKTGTSQKLVEGSYSKQEYNSSFIGFFPASNPSVACLILVNSPKVGKYGSTVAAPIFKNMTKRILEADPYSIKENVNGKSENKFEFIFAHNSSDGTNSNVSQKKLDEYSVVELNKSKLMPDLSGYTAGEAIQILTRLGIKCKVSGSGKIVSQSIKAGEEIKRGTVCELICEKPNVAGANIY